MRHVQNPSNAKDGQTELNFQSVKGKEGEVVLSTWRFDEELARKILAKMIIIDELPFKFLKGEGFKELIAVLCLRFRIPLRWMVTWDYFQLYLDERLKLKNFLKNSKQRICITIDSWTSIQRMNYMCINVHFIDGN